MPRVFTDNRIFRALTLVVCAAALLSLVFAQNRSEPVASPTPVNTNASSPSPSPTPTASPTPSPPAPAPVMPDDDSLLAMLLSERSRNLHQWGSVTQFNGLPSDRVNAIAQTPEGFLWFGTDLGLARFDGRRVETVTGENFANLRILALKTEAGGGLWIGTARGAYLWRDGVFRSVAASAGIPVNEIAPGEDGEVYLAAESGVVWRIAPAARDALGTEVVFEKPFPIKTLFRHDGALLVGTQAGGLYRLANGRATEAGRATRAFFVNALSADAAGRLWAGVNATGGESGLLAADADLDLRRAGEELGAVTALSPDRGGNLYVGTRENGAYLFRDGEERRHFTFENTAGGLRANEILSVFVDRESVVWFGTTKGISRFDPQTFFSEQFSVESRSNFIRAIYETRDGRVFAGTQRGLFLSEEPGRWRAVEPHARRTIYAVNETEIGRLLLGTVRGLQFYPAAASVSAAPPPPASDPPEGQTAAGSVRAIERFQRKTYLAVFGQGLATLENGAARSVSGETAGIAAAVALRDDGAGRLWIGTAENGAYSYDGREFQSDARLDALKGKAVWAIEGSEADGLWFGTERGLFVLRGGVLENVFADIPVRGIALSPDGVWCATDQNGLMRVRWIDDFGWTSSRLDVEQGLPSQKVFTIARLADGALLIGTNRGIVRYTPPDTPPALVATRVLSRRLHAPAEMGAPITLEYPQNTLTLDVAGLSSRTFPEQFQYAYLLRDAGGAITRRKFGRDAQFTMDNLAPGDYTVEARAFDKNLIASRPLAFALKVEKAPFPWVTFALTVLLLLALIALVWAVYSQKRIHQQSGELKETNLVLSRARLDLANEAERERRRISRDLHDQTLADLRHLQLLADKLPREGETAAKARLFRAEIENVSREIRRICEDLSPSVLENIGFAAALEWALANALETGEEERRFATEFHFDESLEENLSLAPSRQIQIYRIVQEVLGNIARHSAATRVRLAVARAGDEFRLTIEDDGRFFDPFDGRQRDGRGLNNIRARAELIDAAVSFRRTAAGGTLFTLSKPLAENVAIHTDDAR